MGGVGASSRGFWSVCKFPVGIGDSVATESDVAVADAPEVLARAIEERRRVRVKNLRCIAVVEIYSNL